MSLEFSTKEELVAKVEELRRELSRVDGVEKAHRELRKKYDNLKRDHEKLEDQHEELKKQHQDMQRDVWAAIEDGALDEQMWKSEDVMTGAWLLKLRMIFPFENCIFPF